MTKLLDISIRHQIYLEGLKNGKRGDLAASLALLQQEIVTLIHTVDYDDLGQMKKVELALLLGRLKKLSDHVFAAWLTNLIRWLTDYIDVDRDLWQFALTEYKVQNNAEDNPKDRNYYGALFGGALGVDAIYSLARNLPMGANGVKIEPFIQGYAAQATAKLLQQVNIGYADNLKPSDVTKAIIGTKEAAYKDGLLVQLQRQGDAVTNTIIQHVAAQTNNAVAKKGFAQYLWVSVLDSRTTQICMDRNGNVYAYGQGPTPPAHINCRSSTIPFDGTGPVTMPTFTVWVNGQSQEFRNDAFDGPVTASYEGSSPIDLEQFKSKRGLILA